MLNTIPRLLITRGLPASGKTTWAQAMSMKYANVVLVSRDDLRQSLFATFEHGNKNLEDFITITQRSLITDALSEGKDVIVHDCNVSVQYVNKFKKHFARFADIHVVDFSDLDIELCIKRDFQRTVGHVGKPVIDKMAKSLYKNIDSSQWAKYSIICPQDGDNLLSQDQSPKNYSIYIPDENLHDTIIIDIDGTLGNLGDRNPFDHSRYHEDTLNVPVAKLANAFTKTIILTGRDERHRSVTEQWLKTHEMYYELLLMRPNDDLRPDYIVKKEIFFNDIAPYYNVQLVVEDRQQVVDMWRELGIVCAQVDVGNF